MTALEDDIYEEILALSQEGDQLAADENFAMALKLYWKAFDLLPQPQTEWEAATWLLAAIGDANFLGNDFKAGAQNLAQAMHCPNAIGNPFLHLRLGQCQFELGILDRAADELVRAYSLEGEAIFEDDHPKYLAFLKTKIKT